MSVITVFLFTYVLIVLGVLNRAFVALVGALIMLVLGAITPRDAFFSIDFDTVGLLVGMMIIVGITRETGFFEYLAIKAAQKAKGEPLKILATQCLITAVLSAFLDSVTTVMLIIPVTLAITRKLKINPIPFLIAIILTSNIGGSATLVGDPPNIMISGFTGLGFMDFVVNLAPVVIVIYIVTMAILKLIYKNQMVTFPSLKQKILNLNALDEITDKVMLMKCFLVLLLTVSGFILHQIIKLEPAFIAFLGAIILMVITKCNLVSCFKLVEWTVILFFIGLFIMVGALSEIRVFENLARTSLNITGGNILSTGLIILWFSAITSAFVDNIPLVAAMIPLIQEMGRISGLQDLTFFWWCLSLGSLGGNGTPIGASANIVVIGMAEKRGLYISFLGFMKVAFPLMLLSMLICTGYLLFWFFIKVLHMWVLSNI